MACGWWRCARTSCIADDCPPQSVPLASPNEPHKVPSPSRSRRRMQVCGAADTRYPHRQAGRHPACCRLHDMVSSWIGIGVVPHIPTRKVECTCRTPSPGSPTFHPTPPIYIPLLPPCRSPLSSFTCPSVSSASRPKLESPATRQSESPQFSIMETTADVSDQLPVCIPTPSRDSEVPVLFVALIVSSWKSIPTRSSRRPTTPRACTFSPSPPFPTIRRLTRPVARVPLTASPRR